MLRIECGCGKTLKVADEAAGKKVKCPACGELSLVQKPASAAVSAKPLPRTRPVDDDEEDRGRAKKTTPAKKGRAGCLLLLLLGGAVVGFFGLLAVGGAVWFFFLRSEPVSVKFFVPSRKGDKREIKVAMEGTTKITVDAPGADPDAAKFLKNQDFKFKSRIEGIVSVLEVNDKGEETKVEVTVTDFDSSREGDNMPNLGKPPDHR